MLRITGGAARGAAAGAAAVLGNPWIPRNPGPGPRLPAGSRGHSGSGRPLGPVAVVRPLDAMAG